MSLELIFFVVLSAIGLPDIGLSSIQPWQVTWKFCLISIPWVIFSLPAFLKLGLVPNRMDSVLPCPKWILSLQPGNRSHMLQKSFSSVFQFQWHIYVERQSNSHQRIAIDLMTQLASYHWRISEKWKCQELALETHHNKILRCLNTYFQCLLKLPDQPNINKTNWQYWHKN